MTRRERLERKAERRRGWATSRRDKAESLRTATPGSLRDDWAFITQPGHIPERARMNRRDERAHEHDCVARHHEQRAAGLETQLKRTVFSDDVDAVEKLQARIREREQEAEAYKRVNRAWRKGGAQGLRDAGFGEKLIATCERTMSQAPWLRSPLDTTHLRASIRRDRKRLEEITRTRG